MYALKRLVVLVAVVVSAAVPLRTGAQMVQPPEPPPKVQPPSAYDEYLQRQNQRPTQSFAPAGPVIDYRETMRQLVQDLSAYGRRFNPNFAVIAENGLDLAGKINLVDDTQIFPARTYLRAVDGMLEPELQHKLHGDPNGDEKTKNDPAVIAAQAAKARSVHMAKLLGLKIFDLEYADNFDATAQAYSKIGEQGFIPFIANSPFLNDIPASATPAFNANAKSLDNLLEAQNFLYVSNSMGFGTAQDFVQAVSYTNHDLIIANVFHGRQPLTRLDVDRMKYKKLGSRRLVLAELDVATAATYHYYWQQGWQMGNPTFIDVPLFEDPDRYRVKYWMAGWQSILSGGTNSYLYGIIDLGFDGVVLKNVGAWRYYESGGEIQ